MSVQIDVHEYLSRYIHLTEQNSRRSVFIVQLLMLPEKIVFQLSRFQPFKKNKKMSQFNGDDQG